MNIKPWFGTLATMAAPAGTALSGTPWWMFIGVLLLVLTHRILPRDSKDLLMLWLQIISRGKRTKGKRKNG
ncbi:MAG: hypothetical protein ACRDT6_00160 [Micromonosporaceae bacterium]